MTSASGRDATPQDVLLYDGTCGFCAASIQFVLRHDRAKRLTFAPLQGALAADVKTRHPGLESIDSMVWVNRLGSGDERIYVRSAAALQVAAYLGGPWRLAAVARLVPAVVRDAVYALIARHRHRLIRGGEQCLVPGPDERARFLA
jgi:predicted DCC family thiol-disulfide oxidoreductase YuxK